MTVHGEHDFDHVVEAVADQAGLDSSEAAGRLIESVTGALVHFIDPEAWDLIVGVVPTSHEGASSPRTHDGEHSLQDFFGEVAEREGVEVGRAALYARVVTENVKGQMTEQEVGRLSQLMSDDFLALFEDRRRGELTSSNGVTRGASEAGEDERS